MLSSRINSKVKAIWRKLRNKEYRDSFVASQISNTIAAQIFSLREARGWKQAEVAARAGMKQSRISDLEDPNYENYQTRTLVKLASAFDVGLVVRFVPFSELAKLWDLYTCLTRPEKYASVSKSKGDVPCYRILAASLI